MKKEIFIHWKEFKDNRGTEKIFIRLRPKNVADNDFSKCLYLECKDMEDAIKKFNIFKNDNLSNVSIMLP